MRVCYERMKARMRRAFSETIAVLPARDCCIRCPYWRPLISHMAANSRVEPTMMLNSRSHSGHHNAMRQANMDCVPIRAEVCYVDGSCLALIWHVPALFLGRCGAQRGRWSGSRAVRGVPRQQRVWALPARRRHSLRRKCGLRGSGFLAVVVDAQLTRSTQNDDSGNFAVPQRPRCRAFPSPGGRVGQSPESTPQTAGLGKQSGAQCLLRCESVVRVFTIQSTYSHRSTCCICPAALWPTGTDCHVTLGFGR
jgi:hypothetical protein